MKVMDQIQPAHGLHAVDDQIDQLCDAFEAAWQRSERQDIAQIIDRADERLRRRLFYELLLVEIEYRVSRGERPSRDDYMREFPQFAELIEAAPFNHDSKRHFVSACEAIDRNLNGIADHA